MISEPVTRFFAPASAPGGIGERLRRRRWLVERDRASAHLAELHHIRTLLNDAAKMVEVGWLRHSWFTYADELGHQRPVTARTLHQLADRPVTGACLVGAVVHAAGGPSSTGTQPVQRALDLTWHALYRSAAEPVAWCPAPAVRAAQVRDLTAWNDREERTREEVTALLRCADRTAEVCITRLRSDQRLSADSPAD